MNIHTRRLRTIQGLSVPPLSDPPAPTKPLSQQPIPEPFTHPIPLVVKAECEGCRNLCPIKHKSEKTYWSCAAGKNMQDESNKCTRYAPKFRADNIKCYSCVHVAITQYGSGFQFPRCTYTPASNNCPTRACLHYEQGTNRLGAS